MAVNRAPFKEAVTKCKEIAAAFQPGLKALGAESCYVRAFNPQMIEGSVNIDKCLKTQYPHASRWDYAIGYDGNAFFVEIQPADTSNVDEMIRKVGWLRKWLSESASDLQSLHKCKVFHWIPTGRVRILKGSTQYKKIAKNNLVITDKIMLLK